ncbi:MAG: alginate lyase, partial [Stenotrophomonas bentonitica]
MNHAPPLMLLLAATLGGAALPAAQAAPAARQAPAASATAPVLVTAAQWTQMRAEGARSPLFAREQQRAEQRVRSMMKAGFD